MPEVVDTVSSDAQATESQSGSMSRLKKLTSAKSWVSPFRDQNNNSKNLRKQLKDENAITLIHVPSKFTLHPTLEEEKRKKKEQLKKEKVASTSASTKSLKDEPIDTPKADSEVEPVEDGVGEAVSPEETEEKAEEAAEDKSAALEETADTTTDKDADKGAESDDKGTEAADEDSAPAEAPKTPLDNKSGETEAKEAAEGAVELDVTPEAKYAPVEADPKTLEKLQDKPLLLDRYRKLNADAIGSVSKTLDDPNKVVDLGSGLKMTQQQLLDIAAKRVAPVLTSINTEVSKTLQEDQIKHQQNLDGKTANHNKKLQGEFDKFLKKLTKQKETYTAEMDNKLEDLSRMMKNAEINAANFKTQNATDIETANAEYADREEKAVAKHETDKETLLKNHDELVATKKQELEDSKTEQEAATKEIEELQEKKSTLDNKNLELSDEIEKLSAELKEKEDELADLKSKHEEKLAIISKNGSTKEELDEKISSAKKDLEVKRAKKIALGTAVAGLGATLAAYTSKLTEQGQEKAHRTQRLKEAKGHFADWEQEKVDIATQVARQKERDRVEAEANAQAEKERKQKEKEQKEQEEAEERARKEEEAAEAKAAKEKEEAEAKAQREKEADPEYQRQLRIEQREKEQEKLYAERDENTRIHEERKAKEEDEAAKLQAEIEALRQQKDEKAEAARKDAELVAQTKLDEIEKLKKEHDERLRLIQERIDAEELQKSRLLEEVDNLQKIRQLREEKARLATELERDVEINDIQKLIEQREIEVARLSKQIEYDDAEARNYAALQTPHSSKSVNASVPDKVPRDEVELKSKSTASNPAVLPPLKEKEVSSKPEKAEQNNKSSKFGAAAAGVGALGAGAAASAAAGAAAIGSTASGVKNQGSSASNGVGRAPEVRRNSLRNSFKKIFKSDNKQLQPATTATAAPVQKKSTVKAVDIGHQPAAAAEAASSSDEAYSVYEEVSDGEFEANENDPNYFEISEEEFEKHRAKSQR